MTCQNYRESERERQAAKAAKVAMRREMAERRRRVPAALRERYSLEICEALEGLAGRNATVAVYIATQEEISLEAFIKRHVHVGDLRLAAPRWDSKARTYGLARLTACEALVAGRWGIQEPPQRAEAVLPGDVDFWIVPGLAFTRDGWRLGYGGGFYDRFLAAAKPSARSIAVAFPFQIVEALPVGAYDRPVDRVLAIEDALSL